MYLSTWSSGQESWGLSYLDEGITDVYAEYRLDEGADDEVTHRDVGEDDIVGGAREVWEISECDPQHYVDHGTDQSEEQLGKYQESRLTRLQHLIETRDESIFTFLHSSDI